MTNEKLRRRIIKLLAMSYALDENFVWNAYERIGSIDKLLNLLENNLLERE